MTDRRLDGIEERLDRLERLVGLGHADLLLRREEVEAMVGLSAATIYQMMARGEFPRPRKLGKRSVRWPLRELREFIDSCPRYMPGSNRR